MNTLNPINIKSSLEKFYQQILEQEQLEHEKLLESKKQAKLNKPTRKEYKKKYDSQRDRSTPYTTPNFCSIDGEAIKHGFFERNLKTPTGIENVQCPASHYVMLQSDATAPLFAPCLLDNALPVESLSTISIFEWLFSEDFKGKTIIGYYLNYDYENILKDIPLDLYLKLLEAEEITWKEYTIWLIPKKILKISKGSLTRTLYDHSGYWQRSFIKTIKAQKVCTDSELAIIEAGKSERNIFTLENYKQIAEYNQLECVLLTRVVKKLFDDIALGFKEAGIKIIPHGKDSFSPGCLSKKAFKLIDWKNKHPKFNALTNKHFKESLGDYANDMTLTYPFTAAFAGGRIESALMGVVNDTVYGNDIRSAYPKALAMMPEWQPDDIIYTTIKTDIDTHVLDRLAGMYLITWNLPKNWNYYPFHFRSKSDNVFFPAVGKGWISCLELYAALDTIKNPDINIEAACVIANTFRMGDIKLDDQQPPTETGHFFINMYDKRRELKTNGNAGEIALKLTPNAFYGKLIQQVGVKDWTDENSLLFFNDFAGMWTTAYCRANIWHAIAPHKQNDNIICIQTDGVYSKELLNLDTTNRLGAWETETLDSFTNLMPGIYQYHKHDKLNQKQRGWGSKFDFDLALECLQTGKPYSVSQEAFITKGFANHQNHALNNCALQWIPITKDFIPSLASKRACPDKVVLKKSSFKVFKPKENKPYLLGDSDISKPFKLKFTTNYQKEAIKDIIGLQEHVLGNEDYHVSICE